jgi:hypothetical protein
LWGVPGELDGAMMGNSGSPSNENARLSKGILRMQPVGASANEQMRKQMTPPAQTRRITSVRELLALIAEPFQVSTETLELDTKGCLTVPLCALDLNYRQSGSDFYAKGRSCLLSHHRLERLGRKRQGASVADYLVLQTSSLGRFDY